MEGESITDSQATLLDSFQIPSSTQQEPLRNVSDSNSQDSEYELIERPIISNAVNIDTTREGEDIEDFAEFVNDSLGDESGSDLDNESDEQRNNNENDTPSQRLASFPANFRVMYIGQNVPNVCKTAIFSKISKSLSQIFWDEAESVIPASDIGLEKRLVICPVNTESDVEYYQDSGVAVCEADLTNVPFSKALEYLQKTFAKTDQDNLVDLCIIFVPQDVNRFTNELLLTMRKLQEKVTLLPIIVSRGKDLTFKNEKEEKRRAISKLIEDNGIKIFLWKADQLVEDREKWVETVYTKKVLTVKEFMSLDDIFEDLQQLRSRAIEFRKDRLNKERAKKRAQKCDKLAGTIRYIILVCTILYISFLSVAGLWRFAEWSVIPPDLASSLQAVSRASLKAQNHNVPQTISLDNGETQPLIEVFQESSKRFIFNILNKKQYFENRKNDFEVIVTHNPPQILGRYDVQKIGNGRYMFDIDTTGSKGEVLVEIKEKNGSSIKTVTWVHREDKTKTNDIKEHKEEPTFLKFVQNQATDAYQNAVSYSIYSYEEAIVFGTNVIDEIHRGTIYLGRQLSVFIDVVRDYINYWVPIIRENFLSWKTNAKEFIDREYFNAKESIERGYLKGRESIERGYLNGKESIERGYLSGSESIKRWYVSAKEFTEERYLKIKEESLNFARFIKDQYDEIYTSF